MRRPVGCSSAASRFFRVCSYGVAHAPANGGPDLLCFPFSPRPPFGHPRIAGTSPERIHRPYPALRSVRMPTLVVRFLDSSVAWRHCAIKAFIRYYPRRRAAKTLFRTLSNRARTDDENINESSCALRPVRAGRYIGDADKSPQQIECVKVGTYVAALDCAARCDCYGQSWAAW